VLDIIHHFLFTDHKTAYRNKRLAKGAHDQINVRLQAKVLNCPSPMLAQNSNSMSFIYHHPGSVFLSQLDYARQIRNIAFHTEHTINDNHLSFIRWNFRQHFLQVFHIVMLEFFEFSKRQPASINNAGMIHSISDDIIIFTGD